MRDAVAMQGSICVYDQAQRPLIGKYGGRGSKARHGGPRHTGCAALQAHLELDVCKQTIGYVGGKSPSGSVIGAGCSPHVCQEQENRHWTATDTHALTRT